MPKAPDPARFAFASTRRLLAETLDALLPPQRISVAQHAAQHRWLKSAVGAHLELWDHASAPYLVEPMEALTSDEHDTIALVGPAACGKTVVAENWLLHSIHADPADMLWYMQTDPATETYVKGRIEPMLEAHDSLIGGLRHGRDSVGFKRFRGGRVEFLTFTASNLVNKHVGRIVADEVDAYDESLGDPLALLNPRRQAAGVDSKLLLISHPDLGAPIEAARDRQRGIMAVYADSDRRTWWWPCPHCGVYASPNPRTARHMTLQWKEDWSLDEIQDKARLICPANGCVIEDHQRRAMNAAGRWVARGETIDEEGSIDGQRLRSRTAGFWIVGTMSPFTKDGIGGLARARAAAERAAAASGDQEGLRQVAVKSWGEPFAPPARLGAIEAAVLAERADPALKLGEVPPWVRFLTAWADAQMNRFELLVRGWGEAGMSVVVDHQVIPAEPPTNPEDWDALLKRLAEGRYPLADGSGRVMRIRAAGFDGYGAPGVTEQAYAAWRRARRTGLAKLLGKIEHRDAWSLVATKGAEGRAAPRIQVVYPNTQRKDRKAAGRGEVPLLLFNPNGAKDALAAQLALVPPAGACVHFPARLLTPGGPRHEFFEQLAAEARDPVRGTWEKVERHRRNEVLDLMVGAEVVARLHGLHRIDWVNPPAWAAEWERNTMIATLSPEPPVPETLDGPPAPAMIAATRPAADLARVVRQLA